MKLVALLFDNPSQLVVLLIHLFQSFGELALGVLGNAFLLAEIVGLLLDRLGYWPRPGVYWLGASAWPEGLTQLARKLGRLGSAVGAPRERRSLQPHVTLFRSCDRAPPAPSGLPAFRFAYSHFTLFESQRGRAGMHYRPLRHWQLETAPG